MDNSLFGLCYDHARGVDLTFNYFEDVKKVQSEVEEDHIHLPKECMVIATASNSEEINTHPVVIWPTCSRNEINIQRDTILKLSNQFVIMNDAPFLCWSTDGDGTRRQIADSMMTCKIGTGSKIYHIVSKLRFLDLEVGKNEETVDFDSKHLAKRLSNYIIGSNCTIGSSTLFRKDMLGILKLSPISPKHSVEELINPKDKQNVGLATNFLYTLSLGLKSTSLSSVSIRVASVEEDFRYFSTIIDGILCLYSYVTLAIEQQLEYV